MRNDFRIRYRVATRKEVVQVHSSNVGFNKHTRFIMCEHAYCVCSIRSYTRQLLKHASPSFRRFPQILCATVVPEALPQLEHINKWGLRKRVSVWITLNKRTKLRNHPINLRLLQHHFGDKNLIRIDGLAPRQLVPAMRSIIL